MKEFPSQKPGENIQAICLTANMLKKGHKLLTPWGQKIYNVFSKEASALKNL